MPSSNDTNAASSVDDVYEALDVTWLLVSGMIVFSMQLGFCMLEAGSVTSKSTEEIMLKNLANWLEIWGTDPSSVCASRASGSRWV